MLVSGTLWTGIALALGAALVGAQEMQGNCLRLLGSAACPGFQTAYLNPSNLSNAFPFFAGVDSVATFDAGAFRYFSDPFQFQNTKFIEQLGCTNASAATIRYSRTVLCSMWVNQRWSIECTALYDGQTAATSSKMVCQKTCLEYAFGEAEIINNQVFCPGPDLTGGSRIGNVTKDYAQCTNWTSLATNNSATCVLGSVNEGNCGYGPSTTQLCNFCKGSNPDDCCYDSNTDVSFCGYTLPAKSDRPGGNATSTTTSASPSGSVVGGNDRDTPKSTGLSKGALAGIIVGSVLGGLLLLALLVGLWLCLRRRRNSRSGDSTTSYPSSSVAAPATGIFARNPPANASEKGLLGAAGASRTTVGGASTLYSNGHGEKSPALGSSSAAGAALPVGARASGAVLPRVRDENQGGNRWIVTGSEVAVLWPYHASLPDELELRPGMRLKVLRLYDDAWGTGQDLDTGRQGAFPIVCVSENLQSSISPTPPSSLGS